MTAAMSESDLRAAIERELPGVRTDLERLVAIPGIAFDGFDPAELDRSAEAVAELLRSCGLDTRIARAGGAPAVIGTRPAPPGAPTVLLYAHHDVQPVGNTDQWETQPFVATERDGRLYGRGAADDKAGVMAHVAALRALGDSVPVGVVVFVEGEEEYGSDSLEALLEQNKDDLACDVIVIADSSNWEVGVPALTTSLRGGLNATVSVRTLDNAVHSGMFGGPVPDALTVLARIIASFHDDNGDVAIDGLVCAPSSSVDYPVERFRADAGIIDGVRLIGSGSVADRLWNKPAVSVAGIDAPAVEGAPGIVVPAARAKIGIRLAPGDDPARASDAFRAHVATHTPWGVRAEVDYILGMPAYVVDATGPVYDTARDAFAVAWDGTAPVDIGVGGSIPFISTFSAAFPGAAILVTGVEDPKSQAHSPNESLHLGEFARVCLAEALMLNNLA